MFGLWSEELEGRCRGFSTQVIALLGWRWIRSHWSHLFRGFALCSGGSHWWLNTFAALTSKTCWRGFMATCRLIVLLDTRVYLLLTKTLRCSSEPLSVLVFLRFMKNKCPQLSRGPYWISCLLV